MSHMSHMVHIGQYETYGTYAYICIDIWLYGYPENQNDQTRYPVKTKIKNIDPIRFFGQLCDLAKFPLLTPYVNFKIKIDKAKSS